MKEIFIIRQDKTPIGYIYQDEDGDLVTEGQIGYNTYANWIELIKGLQGFGIAIDDFYW